MLVTDYQDRYEEFLAEMAPWVGEGRIKVLEDIVVGLENAPQAFLGLFDGANTGKLIVRVSEDPTR
jgi:NADPH-dependent curcumin reductase CurA